MVYATANSCKNTFGEVYVVCTNELSRGRLEVVC
jgi:hypothetical protein